LDIEGALGRADLSAVHLLHSVRTGEAGFPALYGRSFWEDLASDPERTALYAVRWARTSPCGHRWLSPPTTGGR
jgi:hypothetical protein